MKKLLRAFIKSFFSLAIGLILTYFIFSLMTNNWTILIRGVIRNFQKLTLFSQLITTMTILVFVSLALSITSRSGIIDISAPGKLLLSSLAVYLIVYVFKGQFWAIFLGILVGFAVLMLVSWAMIFLRFRFNVNEVIFGIMINWIIIFLYQALTQVTMPWISNFGSATSFTNLLNFRSRNFQNLSWFIFIALFFAIVIFVFYRWTSIGHQIKIIGTSRSVAKTVGIRTGKISLIAISISSLFISLASATYIFSKNAGALPVAVYSTPSEGWTSLAVSAVSYGNPIGIVVNSILFASIETSQSYITMFSDVHSIVLQIVVGILMITISTMPYIIKNYHKLLFIISSKIKSLFSSKNNLALSKMKIGRQKHDKHC